MKTVNGVCGRCRAKISTDTTREVCPACLLESGLGLFEDELEPFLKEQPENFFLMGDLALTNVGLGNKAAALALAERAIAANPIEKDAAYGPIPFEILARVAAQIGEPDRAIAALQKLLSIPGGGVLAGPLTPALLRLDPMFDPLRGDPRFQKLCEEKQP